MSFARVKATGSGKLAFRLKIEGMPYEFVTDSSMEKTTSDGRVRYVGLMTDGIEFSEEVNPAYAELDISGPTLTINDVAGKATELFGKKPTRDYSISAEVSTSATTISVNSGTAYTAGSVVWIDSEAIKIGTVSASAFNGCTRGHWDTLAQRHYVDYTLGLEPMKIRPEVINHPRTIEGRRAWVYAYGEGDDPQGDGTEIFKGVCLSDAEQTAPKQWTVATEGVLRLWEQDFGEKFSEYEVKPRGVYYTDAAPLTFKLTRYRGSTTPTTAGNDYVTATVTGFFDDNHDFVDYLNASTSTLQTAISNASWSHDIKAEVSRDGGWEISFEATADLSHTIWMYATSAIDGTLGDSLLYTDDGEVLGSVFNIRAGNPPLTAGERYRTAWMDTRSKVENPRQVPRGTFGLASADGGVTGGIIPGAQTSPHYRLYYDGPISPGTDVDDVILFQGEDRYVGAVTTTDTDNAFIEAPDLAGRFFAWSGDDGPEIHFGRRLASGNLSDAIEGVIASVANDVNRGAMPFITSGEVATASIAAVANALTNAGGYAPAGRNRIYTASTPMSFMDFIKEEMKLIGAYPIVDSNNKISIKAIEIPSDSGIAPSFTLNKSKIDVTQGFPITRKNGLGIINQVKLETVYDSVKDEHIGRTFHFNNVKSFGQHRTPNTIEVAPKSLRVFLISAEQAATGFNAVLGFYGNSYSISEIPVNMQAFDVRLGDVIAVTSDLLADSSTGTYGIADKSALVIGRSWNMKSGGGMLKVILMDDAQYGYAPEFGLTAATNVSGNQWTLTVRVGDPFSLDTWGNGSDTAEDYLAAGMQVRLREIDTAASSTDNHPGEVDSVSGNTVTVTFDAATTPDTSGDVLVFDRATGSPTATQQAYTYVADTSGQIGFSTYEPARKLS